MTTRQQRAGAPRGMGFSLIELMVVLAVIAILAAIAIPNYTAYVIRGQRAAARGVLVQTAQTMERYYTANGSYGTAGNPVPLNGVSGTNCAAISPTDSGSTTYCITGAVTTTGYNLSATPCGDSGAACPAGANTGFVDPTCDVLTLNNSGQKGIIVLGSTQVAGGTTGTVTALATQCWQQ